ncbi:MAG: flagellar motor switch protein FliG [Pyrinomonadaceae bacterium]|nr:flagellar motor switch protein FliG [Pyrinomonadaceae bacterium]
MDTAAQTQTEDPVEEIDVENSGEESGHDENGNSLEARAEKLSGARKAAILCLSLGEDAASVLFQHLTEEEVQLLSRELALLPDVKSETAEEVIEEFNQLLVARNYVTTGGVDYAKRLLVKSFGNDTAKKLTDKVVHSLESSANFDALQQTDPEQLAKLFQSEHPQTIAVVLAHLDAATAADVLHELPDEICGEIIVRLAALETVSQNVVKRISQVLNQKLTSVSGMNPSEIGGVKSVAEIFNRLDRDNSKKMLEQIQTDNEELSTEIRNMMVTFEDLLLIDDIGIREIMQRVDKKVLSLALKGTVDELQERFYVNMSSRAVEMMKEEMDFMGQVKLRDVNEAQRQVIEILRELDEEGVVSLGGGGGGEDEYVT